jgi:hypothetical protein
MLCSLTTLKMNKFRPNLSCFCLVALAMLTTACGGKAPAAFVKNPFPLLTWMGESTKPAGTVYPQLGPGAKFGSVSGLAPDAVTKQWVGAIDERDHSRLVWLSVNYAERKLDVAPTRMVELRAGPDVPGYRATEADLEGIVALKDGTFMASEEGHFSDGRTEAWHPSLLHITRDGLVTAVIDYPQEFRLTTDRTRGVRNNLGFEGLAITPKGHLIAGLEQPLIQDGPVTSFERPGAGRLVEFEPKGTSFVPARQWRYMISPTPHVDNFEQICSDGENGLVELLALSDTTLISMERACLMSNDKQFVANAIRMYSVTLAGGDARKQLLLDFNDVQPRLSAALSRLDNFEGMTFGPIVDGRPTILVVSDDNFRSTQKTSFLLFGMR